MNNLQTDKVENLADLDLMICFNHIDINGAIEKLRKIQEYIKDQEKSNEYCTKFLKVTPELKVNIMQDLDIARHQLYTAAFQITETIEHIAEDDFGTGGKLYRGK